MENVRNNTENYRKAEEEETPKPSQVFHPAQFQKVWAQIVGKVNIWIGVSLSITSLMLREEGVIRLRAQCNKQGLRLVINGKILFQNT